MESCVGVKIVLVDMTAQCLHCVGLYTVHGMWTTEAQMLERGTRSGERTGDNGERAWCFSAER